MPVARDWSASQSEKPMSLILDALRKAERERELGQAPTIGSQLPLRRRSEPTKRWPLVAGLALVVLTAGAIVGWMQREVLWPAPESAGEPTAEAAVAEVAASSDSTAAPAPSQPSISAAPSTPSQSEPAPPAPSLPQAAEVHPDKLAAMEAAPASNTADAAEDARRLAAEALAVAEAAKAEAEKASAATGALTQAPTPTPAPTPEPAPATGSLADQLPATDPSAATGMAPDPAGVPAPVTEVGKPVAEAMPEGAELPPVPLVWELPLATRQSLPKLAIAMHVWNAEPTMRFVIVNDQRLVEGEAAAAGVAVSEIRREGVVFEYQGQRFLLPRGGI